MATISEIPRLVLILSDKLFHNMVATGLGLFLDTLHEPPARGYLFVVVGFRPREFVA